MKRDERLQPSNVVTTQQMPREQQHQHQHHHQQQSQQHRYRNSAASVDMRSVKSLDFDSDAGSRQGGDVDYTSEPVAAAAAAPATHSHRVRPQPPKKPLRLSLQRAQSLQTVEANLAELDRKRAQKRTHNSKGSATSTEMLQFIENNVPPFHTASLGRNNYV